METVTIGIKGMTCMGCAASVKRVLQAVDGVTSVDVSLEEARATVQYRGGNATPELLKTAVAQAGYEAA